MRLPLDLLRAEQPDFLVASPKGWSTRLAPQSIAWVATTCCTPRSASR